MWAYGAFFNDSTGTAFSDAEHGQVSDNQGMNLNSRLVTTPYYCDGGRYLLHLGTGINYSDDHDDSVRFLAHPEVYEGLRFLDSGEIAAEVFYFVNAEAALVYGPLSLLSEFFYTRTNGAGPATDLDFYGAYAYLSSFMTGENRSYNRGGGYFVRVRPFTNFWVVDTIDGRNVGWGAWEAAARCSFIDLTDGTDPNSGQQNNFYARPELVLQSLYANDVQLDPHVR